jgi:hypothetical protein
MNVTTIKNPLAVLMLGLLGCALAGCATAPQRVTAVQPAPLPDTRVFFYPASDRAAPSGDQQRRDQYECNAWAVSQSHFDPSNPPATAASTPIVVRGAPADGTGTIVGAASGALLGAAVSNPWHPGRGTFIGALTGAVIGTVADEQRRDAYDQAVANAQPVVSPAVTAQAANYKRAMGACLEGRGYSIG